ncbi:MULTISPECIES: insulinase family protein [unclassified Streptomyces]|uniref:M16 family metallopeptidase n=1 Tax=unclassified Streptomyces TaxID=2593676 RepID=UPI002E817AD1|nr:insulinase family protein [Streptomyces sp. NBC_00589]WTI36891.1 insulinase family protein [Streptomyces sp. NBC_00775]WUB29433.1 insulinase family protein [Streptomyces sp. NBC_00589]
MTTEVTNPVAKLAGLVGHTTTQGIPTLYTPRQGEITAGLFFRVGRADETLATAGITHLVEHLALHRLGLSDLHYNGATANAYTLFHVTGSEDEVVAYLNSVCAALRDLPLDRLETEKEILRTEAAGRGGGPSHQMPLWRYGAQGYGLSSYSELGTWRLTPDEVRHWAQTRFTRDNAVLWITSDSVPEGLDLTLPAGTRLPAPAASNALPVTPAYIHGDDGHVVFNSVLRRSTAGAVFADVLGRALFQDLRQEGGYSYSAEADYTPRDADFATLTAYADALPKKQDAVVGGFVDVLARLRAGRIEQAELDSARAKALKMYDTPELAAVSLPSYALSLLLGHPILSPDEHRAELRALTVEDLREVAREMWSTGLLQVPGRGADWAGFFLAPQYSTHALTGTRHRSLEDEHVTLTIGAEGVSLTTPRGPVTVRYDACAAMTARPDGARTLTGHDGFAVTIEPTLYKSVTPERIAAVDAAVPPAAVVRMPQRDPSRIPQPEARTPAPRSQGKAHWGWTLALWLVGSVAAVWGLLSVLVTLDEAGAANPDSEAIIGLWVMELPCLFLTWRLYRRRRRG